MAEIFCKRCLLYENDVALAKNVREYINNLPIEVKVSEVEYKQRLHECLHCDSLINGMCNLCGCFVESRAAKRNMHCAKSLEIW